jgi:hypothetical protein
VVNRGADEGRDVWSRERALARHTRRWGGASVLAGLVMAGAGRVRGDRWLQMFGLQNAAWGAVDLAIGVVAQRLQARTMRKLPDPYAPSALRREHRKLRRILLVNVGLDAGYVVGGAVLWRWRARRGDAGPAGASAGIVVQGAFLLAHDSVHTLLLGRPLPAREA